MPCVKPLTVIGLKPAPLVEPVPPAGLLVAEHEVIAKPSLAPAVNATEAVSVFTAPTVALVIVDASGAADGMIDVEAAENALLPFVFVQ